MNPRQIFKATTVTLAVVLMAALPACIKDHFDVGKIVTPSVGPSIALPLISSELNLKEVLDKTAIDVIEDPDTKFITLVYETQGVFSQSAEELMKLPDQHFIFPRFIDYVPPAPGGVFTYYYDAMQNFVTDVEFQRLDSLHFKGGLMNIHYNTDIPYNSTATIQSLSIREKSSGEPFTVAQEVAAGSSVEFTVPLRDYYMIFTHPTGEINTVSFDFTLEIPGDEHAVPASYQFNTDIYLIDVSFNRLVGYLGQYDYSITDTLFLDIFDNLTTGFFQLNTESVNLEIGIENSYGMPIMITFEPFSAFSPINPPYNLDIFLFGPDDPNVVNILAPSFSQIGETVNTFIETSSNIADAINMSPQYLHFGVSGISNPDFDPDDLNFVLDTSYFSIDLLARLELYGLLDNFVLQDTMIFDIEIPEELESAEFKIRTVNGFPLEVDFQAYFTDASFNVIDSLITDQVPLIEAAPVGPPPELRVSQAVEATFIIPVSAEKMKNISDAKHLVFKGNISTTNTGEVKIYSDYSLGVRMSAILDTNIQPSI